LNCQGERDEENIPRCRPISCCNIISDSRWAEPRSGSELRLRRLTEVVFSLSGFAVVTHILL
jgi:hypothetical protein